MELTQFLGKERTELNEQFPMTKDISQKLLDFAANADLEISETQKLVIITLLWLCNKNKNWNEVISDKNNEEFKIIQKIQQAIPYFKENISEFSEEILQKDIHELLNKDILEKVKVFDQNGNDVYFEGVYVYLSAKTVMAVNAIVENDQAEIIE